MLYVARAAVKLQQDAVSYEKNTWYHIKTVGCIEYRFCLRNDLTYEVIAGLFENKYEALKKAKQMYVTLLYYTVQEGIALDEPGCHIYESRLYHESIDGSCDDFLNEEKFFFWDSKHMGGNWGPGVYEVQSSIDEFESYRFLTTVLRIGCYDHNLQFKNVDEETFAYTREAQSLLSSAFLAESYSDIGMQMTVYCGILEHLAESGKKDECVIAEIENLKRCVSASALNREQQAQLLNFLESGKNISSRQKCKELIQKYFPEKYGPSSPVKIFDQAYSIRSTFSHGDTVDYDKIGVARYMKYLVFDVIRCYLLDKERRSTNSKD